MSGFVPIIPTIRKVQSDSACITLPGYVCDEWKLEWKTLRQLFSKNSVQSATSSYEEFNALREQSQPLTVVATTTKVSGDSREVCYTSASYPRCLTVTFNIDAPDWKEEIVLIEKPIEGGYYEYEQLGDMNLVMQYKEGNWIFPDIEYLKGFGEMNIRKITDIPYSVFVQEQGDACTAVRTYLVDPKMASFPYWLRVNYVYDHGCIDYVPYGTQADENFVETLKITSTREAYDSWRRTVPQTISEIETVVSTSGENTLVCDILNPASCLTIISKTNFQTVSDNGRKNPAVSLIKRINNGDVYYFDNFGGSEGLAQYENGIWIFPTAEEYINRHKENPSLADFDSNSYPDIPTIADEKIFNHSTYIMEFGDECWEESTYFINPVPVGNESDFPYWLKISYGYGDCDSVEGDDGGRDRDQDKNFIQTINISI